MPDPAVTASAAQNIGRPASSEYAPYYDRYISLVGEGNIVSMLDSQRRDMMTFLSGRSNADGDFRYAPGKWSAKELVGHVCDTERVFAYRALCIARGDRTPLPSFDQDGYARSGPFGQRPLSEIIEDYAAVRRASLTLFRNLDDEAWKRLGTANSNATSVRALAFMIAGHELHHRKILEEKYFKR